ncbi:MAG: PfaD family polyunsaturated fatty acid/polyketide biosynthesis protein [Chloroflexi bacterium]|nr:MAG: PfaD family polyunsaturated fatty acid/polyketide biosynthesis protein [Chloroflexota bacterium]
MQTTVTVNKQLSAPGSLVTKWAWQGPADAIAFEEEAIRASLLSFSETLYVVRSGDEIGVTCAGELGSRQAGAAAQVEVLSILPPLPVENLGDPSFNTCYGTRYTYYGGAMASAIASVPMVVAMGKAGLLGSFGAAGLPPARLETAIQQVQAELPDGPFAFNLIHSPSEEALERRAVELYLRYGIRVVEASAFLDLTPHIVHYRAAGLSQSTDGQVEIKNRVIAKISRREVAAKFMQPAPANILAQLVQEGKISEEQASLAERVPMADDVTVEADSGGHTDNRPLVCLMPAMLALRDEIQEKYQYDQPVRVGAAGGISTPASALAAYAMGASFICTGTINQACIESGVCDHTRSLLAKASMADVMMAPSADMFEMGVKVQVLKTGTMFAMRASKLYELYSKYDSVEQIPPEEREKLEKQVFKRGLDEVWADTVKFFTERDPEQITRANNNPKRKMALIFRWYLGLSSRWSANGEKGRELDYQVWCGPSIGPFNDWTRGTYLAEPQNRSVVDVALHILTGSAYLARVNSLRNTGVQPSARLSAYYPRSPLV